MQITIIYTIYNLILAIIQSIGKKWDDELNKIWMNQLNMWWKYLWISTTIDFIFMLINILIEILIFNKMG